MPHHYDSRHWNHEHDYNRNLASRFSRDARHSTHPTINIVNEGKLVVDERTLRNTNAVIYNSSRATLRLTAPKPTPNPFASEVYNYNSYHYPQNTTWWGPSGLQIHTCRSCLQRREIYYAGYCHHCASIRYSAPYQRVRDDRRVAFAPERRQLGWR
ncbi:hypothetical protein F4821DRAFT_265014 [Hypoxylon rubiginosum]|uniref:Uncharacterized protein n=1 Tax=Hypoxylon rubiginosum TaxID=110542 RepID=A0ACC0CLX5_9PEZI|nr:hypothetical protein F4821DRAFT_265014 [Hypoxylon rubiginosum]